MLLVTRLEQQSWFTSAFSVLTEDKVGRTVMLYFLVFCCYWWQGLNNSNALSPRFLLLPGTRLEQQSCFICSFSFVTGDKVGTTVMLYLLVDFCDWRQGWNNSHGLLPSFLLLLGDKVGTIVMLFLPVFSCYCETRLEQQSWDLLPRFLLLLVTKLEQQSWLYFSPFSLVTVDKVGTTVTCLLPRFLLLLVTKLKENESCFSLPVFSCYCGQGWNNSHAYFLVFCVSLLTQLE